MIRPMTQTHKDRKFFHTLRVIEDVTAVATIFSTPVTVKRTTNAITYTVVKEDERSVIHVSRGSSPTNGANGKYSGRPKNNPNTPSQPNNIVGLRFDSCIKSSSAISCSTDIRHCPIMRTSPIIRSVGSVVAAGDDDDDEAVAAAVPSASLRPLSPSFEGETSDNLTTINPRATTTTPPQRCADINRFRINLAATVLSMSSRPLISISAVDAGT
mmetsp:Transcript_28718/g.62505  ORF Transcript_28718/g.62505 Transcript_28718/m.62505 type:complete len:214 (+) Transcript_28718:321-962(+)